MFMIVFFFSSRRRHTRLTCDWSSDVCSSDLEYRSYFCVRRPIPSGAEGIDDVRAEQIGIAHHSRLERSEERRVGKECRSGVSPYYYKKNGKETEQPADLHI